MGGSWTEMVPCGVLVPHLTASALTRQSITILSNLLEVKSETFFKNMSAMYCCVHNHITLLVVGLSSEVISRGTPVFFLQAIEIRHVFELNYLHHSSIFSLKTPNFVYGQ